MPKYWDITLTITPEIAVWPGDPAVKLERVTKIEEGANANVSRLDLSVHTGTHLDAPYHFIREGYGVDQIPLEWLIGPAQVVEVPESCAIITEAVLVQAEIAAETVRVMLKTRNSNLWANQATEFYKEFVALNKDAAEWLVNRGIKLVGIDYLSIAPFRRSRPVHEVLLGKNIVVVEGCNLSQVEPGMYTLICLPLKLGGADGSPVRAVLMQ